MRSLLNALPVKAIVERLREATGGALHEFWLDDVSIVDGHIIDASRITGLDK